MSNWPTGDGAMARLIRAHDWASTPLGAIAGWPQSLETIVDLMLSSTNMMSLVWGDGAIHFHNDGFAFLLYEDHTTYLFCLRQRQKRAIAKSEAVNMTLPQTNVRPCC